MRIAVQHIAELTRPFIFWAAGFLLVPPLHLAPYYLSIAGLLPRNTMLASPLLPVQFRIYTDLIPDLEHVGLLSIACLMLLLYALSFLIAFFIFQWNSSPLKPVQRIYLPAPLTLFLALAIYLLGAHGFLIALACTAAIIGISFRFMRCPECGRRLIGRITYMTYLCPFCSGRIYSWLFENDVT